MHEEPTPARSGRARLLCGLALASLASVVPGCGDGPICASDIAVFITAPDDGASLIQEPFDAREVIVRTNLREGEQVELTITSDLGQEWQYQAAVDPQGTAVFSILDLPAGTVTVRATGDAGECGTGEDEIEVVVGGTTCDLRIVPEPESNAFYSPLPVINESGDTNDFIAGAQVDVDVLTLPGYTVELFATELETGIEVPAGARSADSSGVARYTVTLDQGRQALRAACRAPDGSSSFAPPPVPVFVDTEAPGCLLESPSDAEPLTPLHDANADRDGTQIELQARLEAGEDDDPDDLTLYFVANGVRFETSPPLDTPDMASARLTLDDPGSYVMGIELEDPAGNVCRDVRAFEFTDEGMLVEAVNRQSLHLSWIAPDMGGGAAPSEYLIRIAEEPVDDSNFDSVGATVSAPAPGAPGSVESLVIEQLEAGTPYYVAVLAVNTFGDRVLVGARGPVVLDFEATGAIDPLAPGASNSGLGYQMAAGDFNGDGFGDLAVSAPFREVAGMPGVGSVYVYFGGADGLGATPGPDVVLDGLAPSGQFGNGLAALRWNDDDIDDLAVGVPFAGASSGEVRVFLGGGDFELAAGPEDAGVTVRGSETAGDWFASGGLGFALARARFDDDARDDLILTAPGGGGGNGGVAVLYGGATATDIVLSSEDAGASGDAVALVLEDPDPGSIFADPPSPFFGHYVFPLGSTRDGATTTDDIGVAYTEKNAAVVFRGRARPASPGVTLSGFDAALDLELVRDSSDTSSRFGTAMGSIASAGRRDIVVGIWRDLGNIGRIAIYRGDAVGVQSAAEIREHLITPEADLCSTAGCGLGSAVVNNAASRLDPDVDGDGFEDLIVVGGLGDGLVQMLVWYGGALPDGTSRSSTADHVVFAPAPFAATAFTDIDATPIAAMWAGDVNGDGLEDICWADWSADDRSGAFELLYDDGPPLDGVPRVIPIDSGPTASRQRGADSAILRAGL